MPPGKNISHLLIVNQTAQRTGWRETRGGGRRDIKKGGSATQSRPLNENTVTSKRC
ncbi:MAG: hypothetical protein LBB22_05555 [Treponema sp.]|nr:hypothetical protein [Treponema sp.]